MNPARWWVFWHAVGAAILVAVLLLALSGCVSFRPIEPVITPPAQFTADTTARVEFISPAVIGFRCAERGAKMLGMPAIIANACSNPQLITMPHPCHVVTGGAYADLVCAGLNRDRGAATLSLEFVHYDGVALRCAERGEKLFASGAFSACLGAGVLTLANPCALRGWYATNFCHELAHANGWPADHSEIGARQGA